MRIVLAGLFVVLFLILSIPLMIAEWIVGKFNIMAKYRSSMVIIRWAFRVVLKLCGTKIIIYGGENIPDDRSVLFVGNHRSIFDILLLYTQVKTATGIISKKEVGKVPLLRSWMISIGCLFLDRSNIKEGLKMVLESIERVKAGLSILIFPEGTRNKGEGLLPFKGGSFKIAEKSGCDIIPFAIINSEAIFEAQKPFVRKASVGLVFGEPIVTAGMSRDELKALPDMTRDIILDMYNDKYDLIVK